MGTAKGNRDKTPPDLPGTSVKEPEISDGKISWRPVGRRLQGTSLRRDGSGQEQATRKIRDRKSRDNRAATKNIGKTARRRPKRTQYLLQTDVQGKA